MSQEKHIDHSSGGIPGNMAHGSSELNGKVKERGSYIGLEQVECVIMTLRVIREFTFEVKTVLLTFPPAGISFCVFILLLPSVVTCLFQ